jgi:hypothetical protein
MPFYDRPGVAFAWTECGEIPADPMTAMSSLLEH